MCLPRLKADHLYQLSTPSCCISNIHFDVHPRGTIISRDKSAKPVQLNFTRKKKYTRNIVKPWSRMVQRCRSLSRFCSMKRLGVFLLPMDGVLVHRRSLPRNLLRFPNNSPVPIYTPGWREEVWELSVLPKKHNTVSQASARTRTARSVNERTNHQATVSPTRNIVPQSKCMWSLYEIIHIHACQLSF